MVFQDGNYLKNIPNGPSLETFIVAVSAKGSGKGGAVFPVPGRHVLKEDWVVQFPLIKGMLKKNNIPLARSSKEGEEFVVDYGFTNKSSKYFLRIKSKSWDIDLKTKHHVKNKEHALAVLLSAIEVQFLSQPVQKIRNNSLRVESLKDFSVNFLK